MSNTWVKNAKVAITACTLDDKTTIDQIARTFGFEDIGMFDSPRETLDVAKRVQFHLFITHHDFVDMTGLTMMQTLRSTGNYGVESHLFLLNELTSDIMLVLADNNIQHILTKPFSSSRIHQKLDHLLSDENNLSQAEQKFREAHAAMSSGLLDMAKELALSNLRSNGPTEKLLLLLGDIETKCEQTEKARLFYEATQKFNPNSSAAVHKLAQTYMIEKNFARAADMMNVLTKVNPLNLELLANAGLSNYEVSNLPVAKAAMSQLQSLDRKRKDASEILAKIAFHEGDYEGAMKQLRATHDPKDLIKILNREAVDLSRKNEFSRAIELYIQVIEVAANHPEIHVLYYNLGSAYWKKRDRINSRIWLEKSLAINPDFEKAQQALAQLGLD